MNTNETCKSDFGRANATGPTAIAKATPASSVFPRWPQNTMLTKPIRKLINWEITWKRNPNGNCFFWVFFWIYHNIKKKVKKVLNCRCITSSVWLTYCWGKHCFKRPWSEKKALICSGSWHALHLAAAPFYFLMPLQPLWLSLQKK